MKLYKQILFFSVSFLALASVTSCEEDTLSPDSVIRVTQTEQNDFDKWLEINYRTISTSSIGMR